MPVGSDSYYQEMLDNAKNYNKRICIERRQRLPFLDSQTGVAQNHSGLCIPYRHRGPGRKFGQIYTYPSRRWKKKTSLMFNDYPLGKIKVADVEVTEDTQTSISTLLNTNINLFHSNSNSDVAANSTKPPSYPASNSNSNSNEADLSNQQTSIPAPIVTASAVVLEDNPVITADWEVQSDNAELENEKRQSDSSDYEETYVKKRKKGKGSEKGKAAAKDPTFKGPKRGSGKGRTKKEKDPDAIQDKDKPYSCEFCAMKYKTRPGLSYHLNHSHNKGITNTDDDNNTPSKTSSESAYSKKVLAPMQQNTSQQQIQSPPSFPLPPPPPQHHQPQLQHQSSSTAFPNNNNNPYNTGVSMPTPGLGRKHGNKYCDFCLGDENENKKTGFKEEMVSCADCGRSGHPSCLQFSANMIISVKRYPWQCIECKSCGICGTSDNDDQLLFCDDCDRGYHMYCLRPPLSEPPEGSWSCHLCLNEFYNGNKSNHIPN